MFNRDRRDDVIPRTVTDSPHDPDAELAELAALIESGDTSSEALERIAKLMGQSDPNDKL